MRLDLGSWNIWIYFPLAWDIRGLRNNILHCDLPNFSKIVPEQIVPEF